MNKNERRILKELIDDGRGLLSPSDFINGIADGDRRAVENLVTAGYVEEVPQDVNGGHRGTYSLDFYRSTEKGRMLFRALPYRVIYEFKANVGLYVGAASIIFGLISSAASYYSILTARSAFEISNLEPRLEFRSNIDTLEQDREGESFLHFQIMNRGPVAATQLWVDFNIYEYSPESKSILFSARTGGAGENFVVGDLKPLEKKVLRVDGKIVSSYLTQEVVSKNNIIEAQIAYSRDSDKREFLKFVYFTQDSNGDWISEEQHSALDPTRFNEMIDAVKRYKTSRSY